jgi:hypothetical protein
MTNNLGSKSSYKYECKDCQYTTQRQSQYDRHIMTRKHQIRTNTNIIGSFSSKVYECSCNKTFKHASSLWNHKQRCKDIVHEQYPSTISSEAVDSTLVIELLKQNNEFKNLMVEQNKQIQEQNKQIIDLAKNSGNTTNNTTNV